MRGVWIYQQGWPELWRTMCKRVPGVATAARYGTTELWAFGQKPEKPAGMTWEEFLAHYLRQYQPQFRAQVAHRIAEEIGWHHSHTTDPILPKTQHPLTGVNWQFLLMVAVRGDFKKRKQAINQIWGRDREAVRRRWNKELAELRATDPATYALYQPIPGPIDPKTGEYVGDVGSVGSRGGDHGGGNQATQDQQEHVAALAS